MASRRPSPKRKAEERPPAVTVNRRAPKERPFAELERREGAKLLGSSRIGEIRRAENLPKMGMGDLQRQEGRRARDAEYRMKMLKAGKAGKGRKVAT